MTYRVEWTAEDGALLSSHEMLEDDAHAMAKTLKRGKSKDVEVVESV